MPYPAFDARGPFDGVPLRLGDHRKAVDEGREQLHQPSEWQVHLGTDASAADDFNAVGGSIGEAAVDQYTYAVFPFRHVGTAQNSWLDGDGCSWQT